LSPSLLQPKGKQEGREKKREEGREGERALPPDQGPKGRNGIFFIVQSSASNTINCIPSKFNKYVTMAERSI
jgi:hypothetical protein